MGHILPIFNPVNLNFELFDCLATLSKLKIIGLDNFLQLKENMVQMSTYLDLLPLKLCGNKAVYKGQTCNLWPWEFCVKQFAKVS